MVDIRKEILTRPIQLAGQVTKQADDTSSFRQDCLVIKAKTEMLVGLLRQAARPSNALYMRPARRIVDDLEQVLEMALILVIKCKANGLKRIFTNISAGTVRKITQQLENSIGDVSWLLRVSTPVDTRDGEYLGLPPVAANKPILCLIWEQIAILCSGSPEDSSDAAALLALLAYDNVRYRKLIIEEGGVTPLLNLAMEGRMDDQENAVRAIGVLGQEPESVEHIVNAGVCSVFAKILKEGRMKVQAMVAWAVSEFAAHHPKCQDHFAENNIIWLLVSHLAFETIQDYYKYVIPSKQTMAIHKVVMAKSSRNSYKDNGCNKSEDNEPQMHNVVINTMAMETTTFQKGNTQHQANSSKNIHNRMKHNQHQHNPHLEHQSQQLPLLNGNRIKSTEFENPATKAQMKAMAARALRFLCARNHKICHSISESRALLCIATLLEKGTSEAQYHSALALMEITTVAEQNTELRRSAFKPTEPGAKAVVDHLLKIINKGDSNILIPCIKSIGNLARTFTATETRIISLLVMLLDDSEPEVACEAVTALSKFACANNYLHVNHSKAIIDAGGVEYLIPLIYFGEQMVQIPSLILLCYIAINIPDCEVLAQKNVVIVLEWAAKQAHLLQDPTIEQLLAEARKRLSLYKSRC